MTNSSAQDRLTELATRYDMRDAAYLNAVRNEQAAMLSRLSREAALAATEWLGEAYRQFFAAREAMGEAHREVITLEINAEKAEALAEFWKDLAKSHAPWGNSLGGHPVA
jgi:hypothetical protein